MSLLILTHAQREESKKLRTDIIENISRIHSTKALRILVTMTRTMSTDEVEQTPLRLDEFVDLLDLPLLIKLNELFKEESTKYFPNAQIKELLERSISDFPEMESEGEENKQSA